MDRSDCRAPRHGNAWAYSNDRCRCPDAREAWRLYRKRGREGRRVPAEHVDSTGTRRRIQALARAGWSQRALAARLGKSTGAVRGYLRNRPVTEATVARVKALYDQLSMTAPPAGSASTKARAHAARMGYPPALAWDDDTIDDPRARPNCGPVTDPHPHEPDLMSIELMIAGDHPAPDRARKVDRAAAAAHLYAEGMRVEDIAPRIGVTIRGAERHRPASRAVAA